METALIQICSRCQGPILPSAGAGTGYAIDEAGALVCYACAAKEEEKFMREYGRIALYLVGKVGEFEVVNWSGTFRIPVKHSKRGEHNFAGTRRDVWFNFGGYEWHGVQYGEHSELCHCAKTNRKV
jgi:hypothetical protein